MNSSQSTLKINLVCYFHGYLACQWNLLNKFLKCFIPPPVSGSCNLMGAENFSNAL